MRTMELLEQTFYAVLALTCLIVVMLIVRKAKRRSPVIDERAWTENRLRELQEMDREL